MFLTHTWVSAEVFADVMFRCSSHTHGLSAEVFADVMFRCLDVRVVSPAGSLAARGDHRAGERWNRTGLRHRWRKIDRRHRQNHPSWRDC